MPATDMLVNARVEAVFASDLPTGASVDRRRCDDAIRAAVRANRGVRGCLAQLATAYGDHPETAVPRSLWARRLVEHLYYRSADGPAGPPLSTDDTMPDAGTERRDLVVPPVPPAFIWDITYACPLRCVHCYSESGRRPSRQPGGADLLRIADALVAARPRSVALAGGEPLLVRDLLEVAGRIRRAGVAVALYTGGWSFGPHTPDDLLAAFSQVTVSVDGATADVHDRVRGRAGSYARAMATLAELDAAAERRLARGDRVASLAIDCTVTRGGFAQLEEFCRTVTPRFPRLGSLSFGAAIPSGLATRPGFVATELVTDEQAAALAGPDLAGRLRAVVPPSVRVHTTDNRILQMRPDALAAGIVPWVAQVEPDGEVRAMPAYEGTVGNVLVEPVEALWARAVARWCVSGSRPPAASSPHRPARPPRRGHAKVRARIDRRLPLAAVRGGAR